MPEKLHFRFNLPKSSYTHFFPQNHRSPSTTSKLVFDVWNSTWRQMDFSIFFSVFSKIWGELPDDDFELWRLRLKYSMWHQPHFSFVISALKSSKMRVFSKIVGVTLDNLDFFFFISGGQIVRCDPSHTSLSYSTYRKTSCYTCFQQNRTGSPSMTSKCFNL